VLKKKKKRGVPSKKKGGRRSASLKREFIHRSFKGAKIDVFQVQRIKEKFLSFFSRKIALLWHGGALIGRLRDSRRREMLLFIQEGRRAVDKRSVGCLRIERKLRRIDGGLGSVGGVLKRVLDFYMIVQIARTRRPRVIERIVQGRTVENRRYRIGIVVGFKRSLRGKRNLGKKRLAVRTVSSIKEDHRFFANWLLVEIRHSLSLFNGLLFLCLSRARFVCCLLHVVVHGLGGQAFSFNLFATQSLFSSTQMLSNLLISSSANDRIFIASKFPLSDPKFGGRSN